MARVVASFRRPEHLHSHTSHNGVQALSVLSEDAGDAACCDEELLSDLCGLERLVGHVVEIERLAVPEVDCKRRAPEQGTADVLDRSSEQGPHTPQAWLQAVGPAVNLSHC